MALSDIVNVVVNINQSTIAQQGFGTPLIYAPAPGGERVRTFSAATWSAEMLAAGFHAQSSAYRCARAMMLQNPRPTVFKVGRRTGLETQRIAIIPTPADQTSYQITIESPSGARETATYASADDETAATVSAGIAAVINAMEAEVTATAAAEELLVVADVADRVFSYVLGPNMRLEDRWDGGGEGGGVLGITSDLDAIEEADNDWYALCLPSSSPIAISTCADWIEERKKIFVASTHDSRPLTDAEDDIVSILDAQNYARTHVTYNARGGNFYGAAWSSALLPYEPGQADWKFKQLKGQVADKLTADQEQNLLTKGGSYYERVVGREMTGAAKGGDGVFLDLTQLSDWLVARTVEGIVGMLTASPKVPYTDQGGGNSIWGVLKNVVERAIQNGAVDEDPETWSVAVPKRAEIPAAERAARRWPGCTMNVTPTGAVHSVGTIQINLNVAG